MRLFLAVSVLVLTILCSVYLSDKKIEYKHVLTRHLTAETKMLDHLFYLPELVNNNNGELKAIWKELKSSRDKQFDKEMRLRIIQVGDLENQELSKFQSNMSLIEAALNKQMSMPIQDEDNNHLELVIEEVYPLTKDSSIIWFGLFNNVINLYDGVHVVYIDGRLDSVAIRSFNGDPRDLQVIVENSVTGEFRVYNYQDL